MMAFVVFKSLPYEGWSRPLRVFLNEIDAGIFCKENGSKFDYEEIEIQGECDNACLIATDPELLLALKGCLRELEAIFSKPTPQGAIAKARAAVYKAEVGS